MARLIRLLVLLAAVGGPAAAFGGEKAVRLDVEGEVRDVRTYAPAAPDLLRRLGLQTGDRDLVQPGGPLQPGSVVRVRRAKPVGLVLDGRRREIFVHGLTVGEVLGELGMSVGPDDFVSPEAADQVRTGMEIVVRNAVHAKVRVDGKMRDVISSEADVGTLLTRAGIRVGSKDRVVPPSNAPVVDGISIRVVRVRETFQEQRGEIPFRHREERDAKVEKGRRRVVQQGAEGVKVRRYVVRLEDGMQVSRRLVGQRVARRPRDEVVKVGTGQPAFKGTGRSDEGRASWFRSGGLSAAHRTLPMGTVVHVTNLDNGRTVNVVIRDRGPWVEGRVIDLSDTAFTELAPLAKGTIRVRIQF